MPRDAIPTPAGTRTLLPPVRLPLRYAHPVQLARRFPHYWGRAGIGERGSRATASCDAELQGASARVFGRVHLWRTARVP